MADEIVFTMHKAVVVKRDSPPVSSRVRTRPRFHPIRDYDQIDSTSEFVVREATDDEAMEAKQKLEADVTERVKQLRHEAAVKHRMEELRREGYRGKD